MTINPLSFMSGVWSYKCRLFMEEKVEILKAKIDNLQSLNNENLDIYGLCRNRAKFRMYLCIGELCEIKKNSSKDKKTISRRNVNRQNRKPASLGTTTNTARIRNRIQRINDV